jgi:subtilisin family serine protease
MRATVTTVVALVLAPLAFVAASSAAAGSSFAGHGAAAAPAAASTTTPADMVDVIVSLRRQAPLPRSPTPDRAERLAAVERALRGRADADQRGLVALLRRRRAQGLVGRIRPFWIVNSVEVIATPEVISEIAERSEVAKITPNATVVTAGAPALAAGTESNVARVNAPALWAMGYTGQGTVVANMDTGVDGSHPDLLSRWRGGTNSWFDPNGEHPTTPTDVSGHGTWTMGAMVGGDAGGTSIGVAPGARWIAVKIFNDRGIATVASIHAGFQWLLNPDGNAATADAPNVVNNSWSMANAGCNLEFQQDLRGLRAADILPVFAAGNGGPASGSTVSPANNPEAFAVGATDNADLVDPSTSRGPSSCGQPVFPQLVAPGVGIRTTDLYGFYTSQSGTSLAAPHVAGALAVLLSAFPRLSPDRQAAALESGAVDLGSSGPDGTFGFGRLDMLGSYHWLATAPDLTVAATPSSASTLAGGSVSYAVSVGALNGFGGDVALSLSGLSSAQGAATFAPATIAGGAGSSQLTVTAAASLAPGTYPLTITATSGAITRSTPVSLVITAPPASFSLSATPSSASTLAGGSVSYAVSVGALDGFTGTVALSLSGLSSAQGAATFAPATIADGAGSSKLTVKTSGSLAPGSYPLTISGTSGQSTRSAVVTLEVSPKPDFGLTVTPVAAAVVAGRSTAFDVAVSSQAGFAGNVALSVTGLPPGAKASFSPSPVKAPGGSKLTVTTSRATTQGTATLTVTAKNGALVHSTPIKLAVTP